MDYQCGGVCEFLLCDVHWHEELKMFADPVLESTFEESDVWWAVVIGWKIRFKGPGTRARRRRVCEDARDEKDSTTGMGIDSLGDSGVDRCCDGGGVVLVF